MHSFGSSSTAAFKRDSPRMLLLCRPARRIYHRDNYCSHEVVVSRYWHLHDLVEQSGMLATVAPVEVLNAPAIKLSACEALARHRKHAYRAVLTLSGGVCWDEDIEFLRQVQALTRAPMYLSGDVACAHPRRVLESLPFVMGSEYVEGGPAPHLSHSSQHHGMIGIVRVRREDA